MADLLKRLRSFLAELKRRKVYRVGVAYLVAAVVVWEGADYLFSALGLPGWTVDFVVVVSVLGFPVALVLAWAFDLTPEGVERTPATEPAESTGADAAERERRFAVKVLVGLALMAAAVAGGWYLTGAGESGTASSTGSSVAVLPFEDISPDSGNAFFARGMHEELLSQLAKVSGLQVKSRTSVLQYEDTEKTVTEIGRELGGVGVILEGSVRRAGDQVRITAQLIDAREDVHLWSETFDRGLGTKQIFDIQAEIASRIADALAAELTPEERRRIETPPTGDLAAYDAYLKGRSHVAKFYEERAGPAHVDSAITHLRKAIRRDSTFAPAHAWLGMAYAPLYATTRESEWRDSAFSAARRARQLNPDLAEAHLALGFVHWRVGELGERGHFQPALEHLKRATELQPSSALAAGFLMIVHDHMGHDLESMRWSYRAARLAPKNPVWPSWVAFGLFRAGLLEPAEAWAREALEQGPDHWRAVRTLSMIRAEQVGPGAALDTLRRFREKHPEHPRALEVAAGLHLQAEGPDSARALLVRARKARRTERAEASTGDPEEVELRGDSKAQLGYALIQLGDTARGRALLQEALASEREGEREQNKWSLVGSAEASAALGNAEEAYRFLERALEKGYYRDLKSPLLESLRGSARFDRVQDRVRKNREEIQREIRELDIELYPDSAGGSAA